MKRGRDWQREEQSRKRKGSAGRIHRLDTTTSQDAALIIRDSHKEHLTSGLCKTTPPWVDCPGVGEHDIIAQAAAASRRFPRTQPCPPGSNPLHDQTHLPLSLSGVSGNDAARCRRCIIYIRLSPYFNVDNPSGVNF